ncbi:MAG TPA: 50S ribosomal protein L6 [Candidatus Angelobacter sp.]|jgi:large subunit ribosomal protein L6|nr:50S ribosomal protein L6 [Candidatus Angelobacter sp.]
MSRIGKLTIKIPKEVIVKIEEERIKVLGKLGELSKEIPKNLQLSIEGEILLVRRFSNNKKDRAFHGLYRALVNNMIIGVKEGFKKELELVGVGYRASASARDNILELNLGFSHNIIIKYPSEIKIEARTEKGRNPFIILTSFDKQLLGMVSSKIRYLRKPEPYKGKGIRYVGEIIRRKTGKSA